jgi:hypothetical protein
MRHRLQSLTLGLGLVVAVACDDSLARRRLETGQVIRTVSAVRPSLGGVEQVLGVRSVSAIARCSGPDGTVTRRIDAMAPDVVRFEEHTEDGASTTILCRSDEGWRLVPGGPEVVSPERCAEIRVLAVHLFVLRHDLLLLDLAVEDEVEFAGQECLRLSGLDRSGRRVSVYVGDTALPVGFRLDPPAAGGDALVVDLSDWRQVGPVQLPHYATITSDGTLWRCTFSGVTVNETDESRFTLAGLEGP